MEERICSFGEYAKREFFSKNFKCKEIEVNSIRYPIVNNLVTEHLLNHLRGEDLDYIKVSVNIKETDITYSYSSVAFIELESSEEPKISFSTLNIQTKSQWNKDSFETIFNSIPTCPDELCRLINSYIPYYNPFFCCCFYGYIIPIHVTNFTGTITLYIPISLKCIDFVVDIKFKNHDWFGL